MLRRVKRASMRAKACKVLMTIEIKSLSFPYEILRSIGQDAELSFTFQRGNKAATSYECELSLMASGRVEVLCGEKIALEVTMYKESESKYQKKRGKLVVQVLTESGWVDLGNTHIDLHVITNDLQPIQISAELEKCVLKGAYLEFIISPTLLEQQDDDSTMESMSEISEMTGTDSPSTKSASSRGRPTLSLTKRLSQSIGLSSPSPGAGATARYISTALVSTAASGTTLPSPRPEDSTELTAASTQKVSFSPVETTHTAENTTSECPSSAESSPTTAALRKSQIQTPTQTQTQTPSSTSRDKRRQLTIEEEKDVLTASLPSEVLELQLELGSLREAYHCTSVENEQLKNESLALAAKLEKQGKKHRESQEKAKLLEQQLQRKDTEIKAVLNFQKKLESRMTAFVEKEKELALKEKLFQLRGDTKDTSSSLLDESLMDFGICSPAPRQHLQRQSDVDIEVLTLHTELETVRSAKKKLEGDMKSLQESMQDSVGASAKLREEVAELKHQQEQDRLKREINHHVTHLQKKPSFRTTTVKAESSSISEQQAQVVVQHTNNATVVRTTGIIVLLLSFVLAMYYKFAVVYV